MNYTFEFEQDLTKPITTRVLPGQAFTGDVGSIALRVTVTNAGEPFSLAGHTIAGYCIVPDGETKLIDGENATFTENTAQIILTQECLAEQGKIDAVIRATNTTTGAKAVLLAVSMNVTRATTGTIVSGGSIVDNVDDLISAIEQAYANCPASHTEIQAGIAPNFSSSKGYTVGAYVWNSGTLYRFVKDHAAGSWASGDVVAVPVAEVLNNAAKMLTDYNCVDLIRLYGEYTDKSNSACSFTWDGDKSVCTIVTNGTLSTAAWDNVFNYADALPHGVSAGDTLRLKLSTTDSNIIAIVYLYPTTLPDRTLTFSGDADITLPAGCTGIMMRLNVPKNKSANGTARIALLTTKSNKELAKKPLKMLVFGSSYTYSTLGMLPAVLAEVAPEIDLTLGICYQSGATVGNHITNWGNNTAYTTYSEYKSANGAWTNINSTVTGKAAVTRHEWDYIVLQQACRNVYDTTGTNYTDIGTMAELVLGYIGHCVGFLYNQIQVLGENCSFPARYTGTGAENAAQMFGEMAAYSEKVMNDCLVTDVLPCGTAIQNARGTTLNEIGTSPYYSLCDDNAGHLRNGIATLCASYAAAYKVCQLMGIKPKMFGQQLNPTDAWLTTYGLMTASSHGEVAGVTDANKLIAEKCALMAVKNPFEVSEI